MMYENLSKFLANKFVWKPSIFGAVSRMRHATSGFDRYSPIPDTFLGFPSWFGVIIPDTDIEVEKPIDVAKLGQYII
jgi:hypothetical protein